MTPIQQQALEFLQDKNRLTAVVASSSRDGVPHAATIYYHVDHEFNFYFLTATGTTKYHYLTHNPQTALVIGTGPEEISLQGQGRSTQLEKGSDEEVVAMMAIKKRLSEHDGTWPIFQLSDYDDESIVVFKFVPESLRLLNLDPANNLPPTDQEILSVISPE